MVKERAIKGCLGATFIKLLHEKKERDDSYILILKTVFMVDSKFLYNTISIFSEKYCVVVKKQILHRCFNIFLISL